MVGVTAARLPGSSPGRAHHQLSEEVAMPRLVILLFGPPGAGKSTLARELAAEHGLRVFDRDDRQWTSERQFRAALAVVGQAQDVRAVVIRSGATSTARAKAGQLVGATHGYLLDPGPDACTHRVRARRRGDLVATVRAVATWYATHDHTDRVPYWLGHLGEPGAWRPVRLTQRGTSYAEKRKKYGYDHQLAREAWKKLLPLPCTVCHKTVTAAMAWHLDHTDDGRAYLGPAHASCNSSKAATKKNKLEAAATRATNSGGNWLRL